MDDNDRAIVSRLRDLAVPMFEILLRLLKQHELSPDRRLALLDDVSGDAEMIFRSLGPDPYTRMEGEEDFCIRLLAMQEARRQHVAMNGGDDEDEGGTDDAMG
jgi:hypothetical protein